jgi:ABC-type transport system substrate-binding protein
MTSRARSFTTVVLAAILAVALAGCGGGTAGPSASPTTTASPTQTPTATPEPDPTPTDTIAPANLPTDCGTLATPDVWNEAVGDLTLQSDGEGFTRPAPENATLALGCDWIVGDSTGILLLISTAAPADVAAAVTTLPGLGYSCAVSDDFGADFCQLDGGAPDTEEMIVARDGVWIYMQTSNRNGRALLSGIATQIWG